MEFGKKRSSKNNKNEVGKEHRCRVSFDVQEKGTKWIPIPHTCDCYKMHLKFRENALPEKEELEADIDSDVATTLVDESSKSTFCMFVELYYCLSL
ncbi:hypothetical protein MtrunA17_Chr4g0062151 [Medicago truncatula]|uniref:Uncharacterized protein n=1 Tax=Medicago truncatula TaxID=3880 RepID=A0A396IGM7_MEDTR|nr:hypothetical protein MtrunA17_Chr4g0062151 [Medicago truncatula]